MAKSFVAETNYVTSGYFYLININNLSVVQFYGT